MPGPKVFLQQESQTLKIFFVSFHLKARIGSFPQRHCQVFGINQVSSLVWSRCVSILATAREAANGTQPSIPADQDVLLHPPIYWNPSSNVSESIFLYWCKILYQILLCLGSKIRRRSCFTF